MYITATIPHSIAIQWILNGRYINVKQYWDGLGGGGGVKYVINTIPESLGILSDNMICEIHIKEYS